MGGKASLLLVLGFSIIFLGVGYNFSNLSLRAVDNVSDYYEDTIAHNIAVSGANMAMNQIFIDDSWVSGYDDLPFNGGTIDVTVASSGNEKIITATGTYNSITKTISVVLQPSSFAKFGWYIQNMSSKVFVDGDTVYGAFHSQSSLNIEGSPVFYGKVTTQKGFNPDPKFWESRGYDPKFYGGFETGVDVPFPNNYSFADQKSAAIDGVTNYGGSSYFENTDLWMKFNSDGTVTYRTGIGSDTASYGPPVTEALSTFAPNGVVYLAKGDIYMSGVLSGRISVVVGESSGLGNGNVYLTDDMTYLNDPMTYIGNNEYEPTSSTDMMGIMATNNLIISDNTENSTDIHIDATVFLAQGGVQAEDLTGRVNNGAIYLRGGVIAAKEEQVVKVENDGTFKGYRKHVIYDERSLLAYPPLFPTTDNFEIVSWYE